MIVVSYSHSPSFSSKLCTFFHDNGMIVILDPDDGLLAQFVHSDADPLVRATQILAIISYSLFAESSLQDVVTGTFCLWSLLQVAFNS